MRRVCRIFLSGLGLLALATACNGKDAHVEVHVLPEDVVAAPRTHVQFQATIDGMVREDVTWEILTIADLPLEQAGTIDTAGLYTAPDEIPFESQNLIYVRATSVVDPAFSQQAQIRIVPVPIYPSRGATTGSYTVSIQGRGFDEANPPQVFFDNVESAFVDVTSEVIIQAAVPTPHTIGPVDVRIVQPDADAPDGSVTTTYPLGFRYHAAFLQLSGSIPLEVCVFAPVSAGSGQVDAAGTAEAMGVCSDSEDESQLVVVGSVGAQSFDIPGPPPVAWMSADLDGDSRDDVVLNQGTQVTVLHSLPGTAGSWQGFDPTAYPLPGGTFPAEGIAVADLTTDGIVDLAFVVPSLDEAVIVPGLGSATFDFASAQTLATGTGPRHLAVGDVDGDTFDDLVVSVDLAVGAATNPTGPPGGGVSFFRGNGAGAYTPAGTPLAVPTPPAYSGPLAPGAGEIALGDVEAAAGTEVVVGLPGSVSVATLRWDGASTIVPSTAYGPSPDGGGHVQVDDFDADGNADIASLNPAGSTTLEIGWGPVAGALTPYPLPFAARDAHLTDITGNAKDDLFLIGADLPYVQLELYVTGERTWGPDLVPTPTGGPAGSMRISPLGGSADPALVVGLPLDSAVAIFREASTDIYNLGPGTEVGRIRTGNFDDDKLVDLLVVNPGVNTTPSVWVGRGDAIGLLDAHEIRPIFTSQPIEQIFDADVLDIDRDGLPDLLVAVGWDLATANPKGDLGMLLGSDRWWEVKSIQERYMTALDVGFPPSKIVVNDTAGVWLINPRDEQVATVVNIGQTAVLDLPNPKDLVLYDVNEDFILDFLLMSREYTQNEIWTNVFAVTSPGIEGGSYTTTRYRFPGDPYEMSVGDLNADGIPDIFVSVTDPPGLQVLLGDGNGQFLDPLVFGAGIAPRDIVVGDFNGDLIDDVFAADALGNGVRLLYNQSN